MKDKNKNITQNNGFFISLEGIDGCGKSVQAEALYKKLKDRSIPVTLVRDPGGSSISEKIRSILLDQNHHTMAPVTELFLYEAARCQLMSEKIQPALERGEVVISDRFTDSTVAYQGYGRSIPISLIREANRWACSNRFPDRTYVLILSLEESIKRRLKNNIRDDRMENQQKAFFQKVQQGYEAIAHKEPKRILLLDGNQPVPTLTEEILNDVLRLI
jgi:dTMP kinase